MEPKRLSPPPLLSPSSRFQVPDYQSHSRSPSRSPNRRDHFTAHELDPLLANLSPVSTLEALRATDAVPRHDDARQKSLSESIATSSASERALGIRAALAGKKLREWCNEASAWDWPDSNFEPPVTDKGTSKDGNTSLNPVESGNFLGSLQKTKVYEIEERIEAIRDEMDALDLEELKDHVRGAHFLPQSRAASAFGMREEAIPAPRYNHLDDFTVIITATIMQALPYLSRLVDLLDVWVVRILVLKQVPSFLQHLDDAKIAVEAAWNATTQTANTTRGSDMSRDAFRTMRNVLEDRVSELAQRIDSMLDALEGREDRIPDSWIDGMESVEEDFKTWVFEAERLVERNELLARMSPSVPESRPLDRVDHSPPSSESVSQSGSHNQLASSLGQTVPTSIDTVLASPRNSEHSYDGTNDVALIAPEHEPDSRTNESSRYPLSTEGLDEKEARRLSGLRPTPLDLSSNHDASVDADKSDLSQPPSTTSSEFSNLSSPQIMDAATVQYFKTPVETTFKSVPWQTEDVPPPLPSNTVSRQSSQRTERSVRTVKGGSISQISLHSPGRSRASSTITENQIHDPRIQSVKDEFTDHSESANKTVVRRASSTSIERLPRREIRNITIRRSSSYSSNSPTKSPPKLSPETSDLPVSYDVQSSNKELYSPRSGSSSPLKEQIPILSSVPPEVLVSEDRLYVDSHIPHLLTHSPELPFPSPTLSEETIDDASNMEPTTPTNVSETPISPEVIRLSPAKQPSNIDDKLTQKISHILANLPTAIRLTSNPDAIVRESPRRTTSAQVGVADTPTPLSRPNRTVSSTAPITLAPARMVKTRPQGDTDIKVYHLHQPGKDVPIKLYVRLVGEGEQRVMVRVGGGWADLGVYLQEYANHHGRRTVSDGRFEIKGLPSAQAASASTLNPFTSGRTTPGSRPGSPDPRPSSSLANRKVRRSSGVSGAPYTPEMQSKTWDAIPGSAESFNSSVRSSSRMSWNDEDNSLGMAGPKSKNVEISPQKKAWVDGMMNQARQVSYEMKKSSPGEFGELGKAGNTRRVFLKSAKQDD